MLHRLLPSLALGGLLTACGAGAPPRSREAFRIVSQSTDPATGQVIYHGVAEDGSGATVQIYGQGDGQLAVQRGPAVPMVRRAPAFRHRARRQAMRRQWTRQRLAERGRRFRGRDRHHGRGCRR